MLLQPRARKTLVVAHVVSIAAWVGIDATKTTLVLTARLTGDVAVAGLAYQALGTFLGWPLVLASLAALLTGIGLGLGTRWGLTQHWWVTAKLGITVVLTLLVCFLLAPMLPGAVAYGQALTAGAAPTAELDDLIYPALVAPTALLAAMVLAVVKPWGRTPWSTTRTAARTTHAGTRVT